MRVPEEGSFGRRVPGRSGFLIWKPGCFEVQGVNSWKWWKPVVDSHLFLVWWAVFWGRHPGVPETVPVVETWLLCVLWVLEKVPRVTMHLLQLCEFLKKVPAVETYLDVLGSWEVSRFLIWKPACFEFLGSWKVLRHKLLKNGGNALVLGLAKRVFWGECPGVPEKVPTVETRQFCVSEFLKWFLYQLF